MARSSAHHRPADRSGDPADRQQPSHPRREHARARRVLGQNFLADPAAIRRLADVADPRAGDLLYEIGAGRGRLTHELLRRGAHVVAYEIDAPMAAALPDHDRLTVRTGDFLAASPPDEPFAVAGNIPYGLTSAIITWCLRARQLRSATLLTQLEYAVSAPATTDGGRA